MSRSHPRQWTVEERVQRPAPADVEALSRYPTSQIADAGGPVGVVGPGIRRLAGGPGFCGPAVTVWTKPGDILYVLKAPDLVRAGDVLVIDGGGRPDAAVIGDIIGGTLARLGCVGLVVDGAVRDVDGLDGIGLPTFARNTYPTTASNEGPGAINVAVQCGGVAVEPGDIVRADVDGIVVIPREHAGVVAGLAEAVAARETGWRVALAEGASLASVVGIEERIAALRPSDPDDATAGADGPGGP